MQDIMGIECFKIPDVCPNPDIAISSTKLTYHQLPFFVNAINFGYSHCSYMSRGAQNDTPFLLCQKYPPSNIRSEGTFVCFLLSNGMQNKINIVDALQVATQHIMNWVGCQIPNQFLYLQTECV